MKTILISPKILADKHNQKGYFYDLIWTKYFKFKVNILTYLTPKKKINLSLNIHAVILTGGNDLYFKNKKNCNYLRDINEKKIFDFAVKNGIPILAICRGFQFVNHYYGGKLEKIDGHVRKNHAIRFEKNFFNFKKNDLLNTNSFHNFKIKTLAKNFELIAGTKDNSIEIAYAKKEKILGLMFHPERKNISANSIDKLVMKYLKVK